MNFYHKKFYGKQFRLYTVGDTHLGAPQCHMPFVHQYVDTIYNDPIAYWVGMGDLIENAIIGSKSDVYTQTMSPEDQAQEIIKLLNPIKEKGLFFIAGNHERRTHREVGIIPENYISLGLGRKPDGELWVPYLGFSVFANFEMVKCKTPKTFKCYFHHSKGGGGTFGGKKNKAVKLREITPSADAVFSGHSHITDRTPITWYDTGKKSVIRKVGYHYIIGSALEYSESYGEEKGYRPATMEFIRVTFVGNNRGDKDNRKQIYEVITPDRTEEE